MATTDKAVAALVEALRERGFVDPDDDTVPTWPDERDVALWTTPDVLARFVLEWVASYEVDLKASRPYFGMPGCYCEHCSAMTGDCKRCGMAMRAEGSELCSACDEALDHEVAEAKVGA